MKKLLFLCMCLSIFLCAGNLYSQGLQNDIKVIRPDLSGEWKLNAAKSQWGRGSGPENPARSWIVTIEQKLPAISITLRSQGGGSDKENFFGGRFTLYSDGRGDDCTEVMSESSSVSGWEGYKLVVTNYFVSTKGRKEMFSTEELELSVDGNSLVRTFRHTGVRLNPKGEYERFWNGPATSRLVFDRIK